MNEALSALLTALTAAGGLGGSAILFGIWDRKRQARQEALSGNNAERKELSENWKSYISSIEADRERKRMLLLASDLQIDGLEKEKNWLWGALHKFENKAHEMRHMAVNQIWTLTIHYRDKGPPPVGMPDIPILPSAYSLYEEEKGK